MTNFASDNVAGCSPEILEALARANAGAAMPYGADPWTKGVESRLKEIFETDCAVFPVATGTAANSLGLSLMTPPYGVIYCHREAHIHVDECGGPEFFSGGAKLIALDGAQGKLTPEGLAPAISGAGNQQRAQPAAISLTQASELGTLYRPAEIAEIAELARRQGLGLHMDGARFANALVALGASPAEITWKAGVDALSFGATKNGALGAEAVVLFKPELAETFLYRRKRGGHLFSKMRFLSAQLEGYLADDLWLINARHANDMAARLAGGLRAVPGAEFCYPVEANEIFLRLPGVVIEGLLSAGFTFYRSEPGEPIRLVTAFNTKPEEVDGFVATAQALAQDKPERAAG